MGNGSLTSDGQYLYICTRVGLLKIGSGYCGTVRVLCEHFFCNNDMLSFEF